MHWKLLVAAAMLVLLLALAGPRPALALTTLDGGAHPSVGHIFAQQSDPNTCSPEVVVSCSATLISSTVAVTSGGCAELLVDAAEYGYNLTAIWISFDGSAPFGCATASRISSVHLHPGFTDTRHDVGTAVDIGVVVLSAAAAATPATLPAAGSLGGTPQGAAFDSVGWDYDQGGNAFTARRRIGTVRLGVTHTDSLTMHLDDQVSVCATGFDGGGAFYPGGQNIAGLAIDTTAGGGCKLGKFLRLDTATSRDFLDDFVALP